MVTFVYWVLQSKSRINCWQARGLRLKRIFSTDLIACRLCQGRQRPKVYLPSSLSWSETEAQVSDVFIGCFCLTHKYSSYFLAIGDPAVVPQLVFKLSSPFCAGKTTFVKRHITGEFEKKYERKS